MKRSIGLQRRNRTVASGLIGLLAVTTLWVGDIGSASANGKGGGQKPPDEETEETVAPPTVAPPTVIRPTVSIKNSSITEGDSGTQILQFEITASDSATLTVNAATAELSGAGAAKGANNCNNSANDYITRSSTAVSVTNGTGSFDVTICGDTLEEPNETFEVRLTAVGSTYDLGTSTATGTITNDDVAPVVPDVSVSGATVNEGNSGETNLEFTVSSSPSSNVTVNFTVSATNISLGSSCSGTTDFYIASPVGTSLTLVNGSAKIIAKVCGDTLFEKDESFSITISKPNGSREDFTIATASATGTISNDDENPAPQASDDSYGTNVGTTLTVVASDGLLVNDSDDNDAKTTLKVSVKSQPSTGTLTLSENGAFTYVPASDFEGDVTFEYTVTDPNGATGSATVTITVTKAPLGSDAALSSDSLTVPGNWKASIDALLNDNLGAGVSRQMVDIRLGSQPAHGTVTMANGTMTYEQTSALSSMRKTNGRFLDSFTYEVYMGETLLGTATVNVEIVDPQGNNSQGTIKTGDVKDSWILFEASNEGTDPDVCQPRIAATGLYPGADYYIQILGHGDDETILEDDINLKDTALTQGMMEYGTLIGTSEDGMQLWATADSSGRIGIDPPSELFFAGGTYKVSIHLDTKVPDVGAVSQKTFSISCLLMSEDSDGPVNISGRATRTVELFDDGDSATRTYDIVLTNTSPVQLKKARVHLEGDDVVGLDTDLFEYSFLVDGQTIKMDGPWWTEIQPSESKTITLTVVAKGPMATNTYNFDAVVDVIGANDTPHIELALVVGHRLEITAQPATRRYGNPDPVFTTVVSGVIDGIDGVTSGQGVPATADLLGTERCTGASRSTNVGTYTGLIRCGGRYGGNYYSGRAYYTRVVYIPATLTITPVAVTIRANSYSRPQGSPNPFLDFTVTGIDPTLVGGVTCTTVGADAAPGSYPITCTASAAASTNFTITYINGTMTVTSPGDPEAPTTTAPPTDFPATPESDGVIIEETNTPGDDDDVIETTDDDDIVDVKEGDKEINTGGGDDKVSSGGGSDKIGGGAGADRIDSGDGDDEIDGGDGDDELVSFQGNNTISGGPGNDKIVSGTAAGGQLNGGPGDDTFYKFVEREFGIEQTTELVDIENLIVILYDCVELPNYESLGTAELLEALSLSTETELSISVQCRENPLSTPGLDRNGNDVGLELRLSDIFNGPQSDDYYLQKSFEEMVNIAWARVEAQRPRFSNWIRQNGVDGVQTYCARTPFPCKPVTSSTAADESSTDESVSES